jgi:hypothetical protein
MKFLFQSPALLLSVRKRSSLYRTWNIYLGDMFHFVHLNWDKYAEVAVLHVQNMKEQRVENLKDIFVFF